jgi:3-isopropylmalate/(R)-2-methylmalate dehydratase small subunit
MTFRTPLRGHARLFGDKLDADWDLCDLNALRDMAERGIVPTEQDLAHACLRRLDPAFCGRVKHGDLLVAGKNTGYSAACLDGMSEDPHLYGFAPKALKGLGIAAVLCESAATNFQRSSFEHALPVVECRGIRHFVREGDELLIDLATGTVDNLNKNERLCFPPLPPFMFEMLEAGGIYSLIQKRERLGLR